MNLTIQGSHSNVKSPMRRTKILLFSLLALITLAFLALGIWVYQLNEQVKRGLAEKKFVPPTEYYSAPKFFRHGTFYTQEDLLNELRKRRYESRDWSERLFPGSFAVGNKEQCLQGLNQAPEKDFESCLAYNIKDTADPELPKGVPQIVLFSPDGLQIFSGTPPQPAPGAILESELIAQYLGETPIMQDYKQLGEVPPNCMNAVMAIEDSKFLQHSGVSITGILRAIYTNILHIGSKQGGSTLTQQLVKNYFLTSEKTFKRKITEFFMSLILETHSSKDEIFETYLNVIYLAQSGPFQIRGIGSAARYYFNKPISELNLPECALVAAVLNRPGSFDPFSQPDRTRKRRELVLKRMRDLQMISSQEFTEANETSLPSNSGFSVSETAPYYVHAVQQEIKRMSLSTTGYKIFTGLQLNEQKAAQEAVRNHLKNLETSNKTIKSLKEKGLSLEGVLLSADIESGLVTSVVGGRSYRLTQFNRAIQAHRQVGSLMKPFVFLTALTQSPELNPLTVLSDKKFTYSYQGQSWSPENYGKKYFGDVPMYVALKESLNTATVQLGLKAGLEPIIDLTKKLGINSRIQPVPSMILGSFELYPIEVLESYTALAHMGYHQKLSFIRAILDDKGEQVWRYIPQGEQVLPAAPVASVISMMKETIESGTAASIRARGFQLPAAGKTGTTSDNKDAWFAGFTPSKVAIAWVGYDNNTSHGLTGASGAIPIWAEFMKLLTQKDPAADFTWPDTTMKQQVHDSTSNRNIEMIFVR